MLNIQINQSNQILSFKVKVYMYLENVYIVFCFFFKVNFCYEKIKVEVYKIKMDLSICFIMNFDFDMVIGWCYQKNYKYLFNFL